MALYSGSLILGGIDDHFQYHLPIHHYDPLAELDTDIAGWYRAMIVHYENRVETGSLSCRNAVANIDDAHKVLGRQGVIDYLTRIGLHPIPPLPPVQGPRYPPPNPRWPADNRVRPRRNGETCHHCGSVWITYGWGGGSCNGCVRFL